MRRVPRLEFRHAVGIGAALAAAATATLVLSLATAAAQSRPGVTVTVPGTTAGIPTTIGTVPVPTMTGPTASRNHVHVARVVVEINSEQKLVAGKTFEGLRFRYRGPATISWVKCDAEIAGKRLHARQRSLFAGPHQRTEVTCSWRIPAHTGGKRLRLWTNDGRARGWVIHIWHHLAETGNASWKVKR